MSTATNNQMIRAVQPQLCLSGDINRIFDEVMNPGPQNLRYNFVVSMSIDQIEDLLGWLVESGALKREGDAIGEGKSETPARLMLEFKTAVESLLSQR
jgi:hypothetical protein